MSAAAGAYNERVTLRPGIKIQGADKTTTVINGGGNGSVITAADGAMTNDTVLSGFTITGGHAVSGGGITVSNGAAPVIEDNIIQGNTGDYGGALHIDSSSAVIRNNTIQNNTGVYEAGGVYVWQGAPALSGNTIQSNTASWGGGLYVNNSSATISGNTIRENTSTGGAGGVQVYGTAAPTITDNVIEANHASATQAMGGGGLNIGASTSPVVTGNVIRNNTGLAGGGINFGGAPLGGVFGAPVFHGNVLCSNEGQQFYNETTYTPDLVGNWWGTNSPGAAQIFGPGNYTPAMILSVSASPASVVIPGSSLLLANLTGGGYQPPNGTTVTWSTTLGSLNPASGVAAIGAAETSLSSTTAGTANVTAREQCGFAVGATVNFSAGPTPTRTPTATATRTPSATPIRTPTATPVAGATVVASFQQGTNGYAGTSATYFDGSGSGYNASAYLRLDNTSSQKSLVRFDVSTIPSNATVQSATLSLYWYNSSNGNSLTAAAHRVLASWVDSQVTRTLRKTGVTWAVAGMGAGSDYLAAPDGSVVLSGTAGKWVNIDVTEMAQAWVQDPSANLGLVLAQQSASGGVYASFCSELRWSPCVNPPKLTITYRP